jgi:hypothetical protein
MDDQDRKPVDLTSLEAEHDDAERAAFRAECEKLVLTLHEGLPGIGFAVFVATTEGGAGAVLANIDPHEVASMVRALLRTYDAAFKITENEKGKMS